MPSKRNPVRSERICGLARTVRALVEPELLCNLLWHERDLTNSSCERVVLPEATMYLYYMLCLASEVLPGLVFNLESIGRNLGITKGLIMAERVMLLLVDKGVGRQEAHSMVRRASMKAISQGSTFAEALENDKEISRLLTRDEILAAMDPKTYLGTAGEQVERVIRLARKSWGYEG
jgi:adenylosuccinate lyase